jgi:O-6-methylguanine DNA methyltransferase
MILCYNKTMPKTFREKVYHIVSQIPKGEVLSYKEVAELAGSPRAYRAVGNLMHNNPNPSHVPCHRVIASNYGLGGFAYGTAAKIKKLKAEGWKIKDHKLNK